MKRVIGIGGIFFKAKNPKELAAWYEKHLGIDFGGKTYSDFQFQEKEKGWTAFSLFKQDTQYFDPSAKEFMLNLRVENLDEVLNALRAEGVHVSTSAKTEIWKVRLDWFGRKIKSTREPLKVYNSRGKQTYKLYNSFVPARFQ